MRSSSGRRRLAIALAAAATAGLVSMAATAFAQVVGVSVGNYYFEDSTVGDGKVTAQVGDQLRFTVVEGAGHTVTISALGIDSGQLAPGAVFVTPALTTPGTYSLICRTHIARNHATTLVVLASAGGGGGGSPTTTAKPPDATTTTPPTTEPGATTTLGQAGTPSDGTEPGGTSLAADPNSVPAVDGTGSAGDTDASAASTVLPVGVVDSGDTNGWLRSVWVAFGTLPLFAGAAVLAEWSARRRAAHDPDIDPPAP